MLPDSRQGYTGLLLQQFPKLLLIGGGKSRRSVPTRLGRQALLLPTCVEPVVDTGDRVVCELGYLPNSAQLSDLFPRRESLSNYLKF